MVQTSKNMGCSYFIIVTLLTNNNYCHFNLYFKILFHVYILQLDNFSLSGSLNLSQSESFNSQNRASISSALRRSSVSIPPLTATSVLSPVSDSVTPLGSSSAIRHFELPVLMEEDEKGEDNSKKIQETTFSKSQACTHDDRLEDEVFAPLDKTSQVEVSPMLGCGNDQPLVDAATQTNGNKESGDGDEGLVNIVMRDVLYKYIPLPPSTTTTPSASQCNLENY